MGGFSRPVDQGSEDQPSVVVDRGSVEDLGELVEFSVEGKGGSICECF